MKNIKAQFKAVLRPIKRSNLAQVIEEWDFLEEDEIQFLHIAGLSKAEAVNRLAALVCNNEDFDAESLGALDLTCLRSSPKSKLWQVHQISSVDSVENQTHKTSGSFLKQFKSHLKSYFNKTDVALVDHSGTYWIRVSVKEPRQTLPSVVYIAHILKSKYFYITKAKKAHLESVKKTLASVLQCESVDPIPLTGRCLNSLIDLTVNQHSQGSFRKYRKENLDGQGKVAKSSKRKAADVFGLVDEESPRKRRIQDYVEGVFGTVEQPALQHVDYTLKTRFRGTSHAVAMKRDTDVFQCQIRFEGPNVLEGIKNLAKLGYAEYPMKNHLANVHNSARNSFIIQQKTADQTTLSQTRDSQGQE